jgi:inhibitor of KinA
MKPYFPYSIFSLGETALVVDFGNVIDKHINRYVLLLFHHFKNENIRGVLDIVPAYSSLSFHYDVVALRKSSPHKTAFEQLKEVIENQLSKDIEPGISRHRKINIPVCYDSIFAPDMGFVSSEKNIPVEEVIQYHTSQTYTVYMIGFLPGFAYMGEVIDAIAVPGEMLAGAIVAAGSVGIAGKQTGIYPLNSPGGWQIIGRTPLKIFDKEKAAPVLLEPGDEIAFYSITKDEFKNY